MRALPTRGFAAIGLHKPKDHRNVGSALRAADCYGATQVITDGKAYRHAPTDAGKAFRRIPLFCIGDLQSAIPFDCVPVAVDLVEGAEPLHTYKHPERALYVFGPEDGTLDESVLSWCRDRVFVPTNTCMNLAATVNVVLYDRMVKGAR